MRIIILIAALFSFAAKASQIEQIDVGDNKIWVLQDHYLPIVAVKITFTRAGSAYDPEGKKGLASMVASMLDEGAGKYAALEYHQELEKLSTTISFSIDKDNFYVSLQSLSKNFNRSLELLFLALSDPRLSPDSIDKVKGQMITFAKKRLENPQYLAYVEFEKLMFADHPYSGPEHGIAENIANITKADIEEFVKARLTSNNILVSVVGDTRKIDLKEQLAENLSKLSDIQTKPQELPQINIPKRGKIIKITKDIPQAVVIFGLRAMERDDQDFYPAYIMNHIFGGSGFESTLMQEIREKRGLAYSTYSYLDMLAQTGLWVGYVATESSQVDQVVKLIKEQVDLLKNKGIGEQRFTEAKDYIINSFPLRMTKNIKVAEFVNVMQVYNLGKEFLTQRNQLINLVDINEVERIAYEMLSSADLKIVIVGK